MTLEELTKPLTDIEMAELRDASRQGRLTASGAKLLRRLLFEVNQIRMRQKTPNRLPTRDNGR
jgi:hypothetical protein